MDDDLISCPICLDFADDAVETTCCGKIFCMGCLNASGAYCPTCRRGSVKYYPSMIARRAISSKPATCPYQCDEKITRGNLKDHVMICKNRNYSCPAPNCQFLGNKDSLGHHILQNHQNELLKNMKLLFQSPDPPVEQHRDPIAMRKNDEGSTCRLGSTGKYYCGGRGCNTSRCCDGRCGPTDGCNCVSCHRLDLKIKQLSKGYLVNKAGAISRQGSTGKFYCGRRVMVGVRNCDGYCGPTDGPQCASCEILQRQTQVGYLYGNLWNEVKP